MADLDDYLATRSGRRMHALLELIDRDPPPSLSELFEALTAEDTPTEDKTQQLLPSSTGQTNF